VPSADNKKKKRRGGRTHKRKSNLTSLQQKNSAESSPASSADCTPEKPQHQHSRLRLASTTQAVETVVAKPAEKKRQRERFPSPAKESSGGLSSNQFGDLYHDYCAKLDKKVYNDTSLGASRNERRFVNVATSSGDVSHPTIRARRAFTQPVRQKYHELCSTEHCEKSWLWNRDPFKPACQCQGVGKPADGVAGAPTVFSEGSGYVGGPKTGTGPSGDDKL
jgi:hypothetical protein